MVAGLGCALPLLLGLFSGHTGFLWATVGAFQAAKADPLHRLGMLRMLLLIALGATSAGLGFWSAPHPWASLGLFAFYGLLLAWLQRYGSEAGKLGIGLAICLCLGQGQYGIGDFNNPQAIAVLFALGGLWVTLLAFGLRGMHGLRMWPYMPRLLSLLKVMRRHARRTPIRQWRLHALTYLLATAAGGLIVPCRSPTWVLVDPRGLHDLADGSATQPRASVAGKPRNTLRGGSADLHGPQPGRSTDDGDDHAAIGDV